MTRKTSFLYFALIILLASATFFISSRSLIPEFLIKQIETRTPLKVTYDKAHFQLMPLKLVFDDIKIVYQDLLIQSAHLDLKAHLLKQTLFFKSPEVLMTQPDGQQFKIQDIAGTLDKIKLEAKMNTLKSSDLLKTDVNFTALWPKDPLTPLKFSATTFLPEQEYASLHFKEQTLEWTGTTEEISLKQENILLLPQGTVHLDGYYRLQEDCFKVGLSLSDTDSHAIVDLPPEIDVQISGSVFVEGFLSTRRSWTGEGSLKILKGKLLDIDPVSLSNTLNLLSQIKEIPLKLQEDSKKIPSYFILSPSEFKLELKEEVIHLNGAFIHEKNLHKLRLAGYYELSTDRWNLKIKYNYPSNPLGMSFRLKGTKDHYWLVLDPSDILRMLPTVLIPNKNADSKESDPSLNEKKFFGFP